MILTIYLLLFAVSLIFVILGYATDTHFLELIGFTFIFALGIIIDPLPPDTLEIPGNTTITLVGDTYTVAPQYIDYTSHFYGIWIALMGILGFTITLVRRRSIDGDTI